MNKSLKTIQVLSKIGKILSKIVFIVCIIGASMCLASILGLAIGTTDLLSIHGKTITQTLADVSDVSTGTAYAIFCVGLTMCLGEIFIAKFSEKYFINELKDGTPFTERGAKEMLRLGILTISISLGTSILSSISLEVIQHSFSNVETRDIGTGAPVGIGIAFLIFSVVFRYGASLTKNEA